MIALQSDLHVKLEIGEPDETREYDVGGFGRYGQLVLLQLEWIWTPSVAYRQPLAAMIIGRKTGVNNSSRSSPILSSRVRYAFQVQLERAKTESPLRDSSRRGLKSLEKLRSIHIRLLFDYPVDSYRRLRSAITCLSCASLINPWAFAFISSVSSPE
jgi:hypothetical protein